MNEIILSSDEQRERERLAFTDTVEYVVKKAVHEDGRVTIDTTDGFGMMPRWKCEHRIDAGARIRVYGRFGQQIRGIDHWYEDGWHSAWFQTEEEQKAEFEAWSRDYHERLARENAEIKAKGVPDLHPALRRRAERMFADASDQWSLGYEMAPILEADRLVKRCLDPEFGLAMKAAAVKAPTEAALTKRSYEWGAGDGRRDWPNTPIWRLRAFDAINSALNGYQYALMKELMPEMDDGHSGNTWGHAIVFASEILTKGEEAQL